MERKLKIQILAVTMGLTALLTVATMHPSKVRAADGDYQLVENWAQLPQGMQWGVMSAVDIDSHGTIYAFKRSEPGQKAGEMSSMVMVIDPQGKFLRSWGEHTFSSAHGLRVLRDGFIWITDKTGDQVFKFSPDGELLMTLGKKGVAGDNDSTDALYDAVEATKALELAERTIKDAEALLGLDRDNRSFQFDWARAFLCYGKALCLSKRQEDAIDPIELDVAAFGPQVGHASFTAQELAEYVFTGEALRHDVYV